MEQEAQGDLWFSKRRRGSMVEWLRAQTLETTCGKLFDFSATSVSPSMR